MNQLFNGRLKYLFLIPIILLIGFSWFYQSALAEFQRQILSEKMNEKCVQADLIAHSVNTYVEQDKDWGAYDYAKDINVMLEPLGQAKGTFAAQYDKDLLRVSQGVNGAGAALFNPATFAQFRDSAAFNNSGRLELPYEEGGEAAAMQVYYRWVPDDASLPGRTLLVVGASQDSVAPPQPWLTVGVAAMIIFTFLMNVAFIALLAYLGAIYKSRNGMKWRAAK